MIILGCGGRGQTFADIVTTNNLGRIVAIAEPDPDRRKKVGDQCNVPADKRFNTWQELFAQGGGPKLADLCINTLMDQEHIASALCVMELGYHMMLEKPMATTLEDCQAIDATRRRTNRIVSVCHSLRYHRLYAKVKEILAAGTIGQLVSIDQLEAVDPQHQSHSFVRGRWANESRSSFMLLTKSCHDLDAIAFLMGENAVKVSSFGNLSHFHKKNQPTGAPARCVDGCPEHDCPYNAVRLYCEGRGYAAWIGLNDKSQEERDRFLRESNWGRCVYDVDNDVVDHQVVAMEFPSGATGTFTMTAFATQGRHIRVHGTKGWLQANLDNNSITVEHFWQKEDEKRAVGGFRKDHITVESQSGGHGGGDVNVMTNLIEAIQTNDPSCVLTDTEESLRSHTVVFAAERSRRTGQTVII